MEISGGPITAFAAWPAGGIVYAGANGRAAVNANATLTAAGALTLGGALACGAITGSGDYTLTKTGSIGQIQIDATSGARLSLKNGTQIWQLDSGTLGGWFAIRDGLAGTERLRISDGSGNVNFFTNTVSMGALTATTGSFSTDRAIRASGQTDQAAAAAGTLANAPVAGNPAFWLPVMVNGVNRSVPCW